MTSSRPRAPFGGWRSLGFLTLWSLGGYLWLWWIAPQYDQAVPAAERPILLVIGVYAMAFVPCWLAIFFTSRLPDSRWLLAWIIGTSVLFRLCLLPTPPFQEIDIYRYLWDGAVTAAGESPYRYPPEVVVTALDTQQGGGAVSDPRLERLANLALDEPGLEEVVRTIHYAEYPSPYPPVSQAVFAAPALITPSDWSATARRTLLKVVLTGFDLATLLVVIGMLRSLCLPLGLAVAYGWCPLVLKETANSGHLDAIAIFLATAALAVGMRAMNATTSRASMVVSAGSMLLLALAVAAKLYPVVLAPLLFFRLWRRSGWLMALGWGAGFVAICSLLLLPMLLPQSAPPPVDVAMGDGELPPAPGENVLHSEAGPTATNPTAGLSAFLAQWEMNDLLFMIVVENLRSHTETDADKRPWFTLLPDSLAATISDRWRSIIDPDGARQHDFAPFSLARLLTGLAFVAIALTYAWRAGRLAPDGHMDSRRWLQAAFVTLAWFWLLSPTQNPWYWCWAVPLLPFVRLRAWLALGACSLLYYTRFWFEAHCPTTGVLGTPYDGKYFFYFVIAWVEFLPWLLLLAIEAWLRRAGLPKR